MNVRLSGVIFFTVLACACAASLQDAFTFGKWRLKGCDEGFRHVDVEAMVPGEVHTALLEAGVLKEDPLSRYNEVEMKDVAQACWSYYVELLDSSTHGELGKQQQDGNDLLLSFEKIDVIGTVSLNGEVIGRTSNAHRSHSWRVPRTALHESGNQLEVVLDSALGASAAAAANYPYAIPSTENWNVWAEPSNRAHLRKPGSDFGWDWGPAFIPAGLGAVTISFVPPEGRMQTLVVRSDLSEDRKQAQLHVLAYFEAAQEPPLGAFSISLDGRHVQLEMLAGAQAQALAESGLHYVGTIVIADAQLWWPAGHGNQPLYDVRVDYEYTRPAISGNGKKEDTEAGFVDTLSRKVGLRTVRLVQEAQDSAATFMKEKKKVGDQGCAVGQPEAAEASFYLEVNGYPIFMRGANFIPLDVFSSRVTREDRQFLLKSALSNNMNMLRVWGGGQMQPTDLYEFADEHGILLWQELMFACSMYPSSDAFLSDVTLEVKEQARRLSSHASIVVWGGNNENEVALQWFEASRDNRDLYVADYSRLYHNAFRALTSITSPPPSTSAGQFAWVDSSPSNGLISTDPYTKLWTEASTAKAGDVHYYDYESDCEVPDNFPNARFVSEFGFQSQPSFLTYKAVTAPEDWERNSALMQFRQRHEHGNEEMDAQIRRHFRVPDETRGADEATRAREFGNYLFLSGVQQGRCYETAVQRWRQLQTVDGERHTMGILYWQLNDIWQGPSWASVEFGGRMKPLQYAVRRAYAPLAVSFSGQARTVRNDTKASIASDASDKDYLDVFAVNDLPHAATVHVEIQLLRWDAAPGDEPIVWHSLNTAKVAAGSSALLTSLQKTNEQLAKHGCSIDTCFVRARTRTEQRETEARPFAAAVPDAHFFLSTFHTARLGATPDVQVSDARLQSDSLVSFTVTSSVTTPFLFLELADDPALVRPPASKGVFGQAAGWFSDNNFVAEAGVEYTLQYSSHLAQFDSTEAFLTRLSVRTLQQAQQQRE